MAESRGGMACAVIDAEEAGAATAISRHLTNERGVDIDLLHGGHQSVEETGRPLVGITQVLQHDYQIMLGIHETIEAATARHRVGGAGQLGPEAPGRIEPPEKSVIG